MCKQIGTGKKSKYFLIFSSPLLFFVPYFTNSIYRIEHVVMSYKHVPTDENEKLRISAAGGLVVFGRLFGSLAVSRSFGDRDYKVPPSPLSLSPSSSPV